LFLSVPNFRWHHPAPAGNAIQESKMSITETAGLGGFAMAAAPAIVNFVGGTPQDAIANTEAMGHITLGRNGAFTLPAIGFIGTPSGIDARKVVDTGLCLCLP
jgi:hypothetical protein